MNLESLRKRFAELESKNKKGAKSTWKPTGEHNVRALPLPDQASDDLGKEVHFHFNIGNQFKVYCPKNDGNDCAICDLAAQLKAWNDPNGKEKPETRRKADFELFRKVGSGQKYFVPIIVRKSDKGDDFEGPIWWEMSPTVYKDLIKICLDEDYNAAHPDGGALSILTSVEHGRDIAVKFMKPGEPGNTTSYNKVAVTERKITRPLLTDRKQAQALIGKIPDISDAVRSLTSAEVQKIFDEAYAGSSTPDDGKGSLGSEHGEEHVSSNNAEKLSGKSKVDDAEPMAKLQALIAAQQSKGK